MRRLYQAVLLCAGCVAPLWMAGCGSAGNPDFAMTVQTGTVSIVPGGTATVTISVTAVHHSQGSVTLIMSGLPGDGKGGNAVGIAPAQATVGIGSTQTFYLVASQTAAPSTTTLTATGISAAVQLSSPITHTATLTLTVLPASAP